MSKADKDFARKVDIKDIKLPSQSKRYTKS